MAIAPYDSEGAFLQYYLFRMADVLLPLSLYVFVALSLQHLPSRKLRKLVWAAGWVAVILVTSNRIYHFPKRVATLNEYPGKAQKVSREWRELCQWVRYNTRRNDLFIVPPKGATTFSLLTQRRMLGTFKQVPLSGGLNEWYTRMSDLAATNQPWPKRGFAAANWLLERYRKLNTDQVKGLMAKYSAKFFITRNSHSLGLPKEFENAHYVIYRSESVKRG